MSRESLSRFLDEHPEYFEGTRDARVIRGDMRSLFEEYALALDPAEYNELKKKVEAFREKEKTRLQAEIEELVKERALEEARLEGISSELKKSEKEVKKLEKQLQALVKLEEPKPVLISKSWYNTGYVFLFLDFLGVFFLYVGIILNERLTMSYVIMGVASICAGFLLQQGGTSVNRVSDPVVANIRSDLSHKSSEVRQISKIKRISLSNRKKIALSRISELNLQIESNLQRINEHNRE